MTQYDLVTGMPIIPRQRKEDSMGITWDNQEAACIEPSHKDAMTLDPNDEFESAIMQLVQMQRKKKADYALDNDRWSNFREAGSAVGISPLQGIDYMVATKQARLKALRSNGRAPSNESVVDTYLDRAVYAVLAYTFALGDDQ